MKKTEICFHCSDDYVPKRRGVQKFCSNSCRSMNWLLKQNKKKIPKFQKKEKQELPKVASDVKENTISMAGVGNAVAGVAIVEIGKNLFTPTDDKPATKRDIRELKSLLQGQRYLPVKNVKIDTFGRLPYYDVETGNMVYLLVKH